MKKYIVPVTEVIDNSTTLQLMSSSMKGDRYGRWGNGADPYGNEDWINEGNESSSGVAIGGDDDGENDSRAKEFDLWW